METDDLEELKTTFSVRVAKMDVRIARVKERIGPLFQKRDLGANMRDAGRRLVHNACRVTVQRLEREQKLLD